MIDLRIPEDLSIPEFLQISQEDRRKAWENRVARNVTVAVTEPERATSFALLKKLKNRRGFERMMERHKGEKYDRKLKKWVPK